MDDDVGVYVTDFIQHISTRHYGQHVADEMRTTSWTLAWLTLVWRWILDRLEDVTGCSGKRLMMA